MAEREQRFVSAMRENEKKHFHNEDLQAGLDFETALKLGCFDKEFMYFATAYMTDKGIACRVSAKERRMQHYVHDSVEQGIYPTPIKQYIRRLPAPSGHETKIREQVKKEAAEKVFELYNDTYFTCLSKLANVEANDNAYELLLEWQDQIEGLYDRELLDLYQSLVHEALESKVLHIRSYLELKKWINNVYKELESDIIPKGQYKKTMVAFAYTMDGNEWKYFFDAWEDVAFKKKVSLEQQGYLVTPMFIRTKWLGDMNEFRAMRENFMADYKAYCGQWYLKRFMMIKNIPGVISAEEYETQKQIVAEQCSKEAQDAFMMYKHRWNIR